MRGISGWGLLLLTGAGVHALTGTVKDSKGAAVEGARVSFLSDTSKSTLSDATGAFSLNKTVSISGKGVAGPISQGVTRIAAKGDQLLFTIAAPARNAGVSLFSGDGKNRKEIPLGGLTAGEHQVAIPGWTPGVYYLRINLDGFSARMPLIHLGEGIGAQTAPAGSRIAPALARTSAAAAAVDTLLVRKTGFASAKTPVTTYDQTGLAVVLTSDTGGVSTLPPITDYTANGPFATVVEANVGPGNAYTIYRPDPLGKDGFVHSPIIFGNGTGMQISASAGMLKIIASHGFVIIGCNILNGGPNNPASNTSMTNGLNWILEQNGVAGSKYQGKLAVKRAASMGYSVGGTAAVDIGSHEALLTVVSIHGHISTTVLHGTLLQTSGDKDNVGLPMQQQTFANSKVPTFLGTVIGADHGYIQQNNGGVERPAIVAWLRYRLYNDTGAKPYFYGDDCIMCKSPWTNPQRKNWQ